MRILIKKDDMHSFMIEIKSIKYKEFTEKGLIKIYTSKGLIFIGTSIDELESIQINFLRERLF